jgi:hypothetical protein
MFAFFTLRDAIGKADTWPLSDSQELRPEANISYRNEEAEARRLASADSSSEDIPSSYK